MKKLKKFKLVLFVLTLFFTNFIFAQNGGQNDPFAGINNEVTAWKSSMITLYNTVMVIGILIGGIVLYFKMKSAEGAEGKKAALNFFAAVIIAVLIRGLISLFGGA